MTTDSILNIRIEEKLKVRAAEVLEASGLTTSSAIRMFLLRVVEDEALPFDPTKPNAKTLRAIKAAKAGKTKKSQEFKGTSQADECLRSNTQTNFLKITNAKAKALFLAL